MSNPTITHTNGRPRKQLSDQLDRLDTIIDVMAEGLPGAVADACREGARAAVKDAVIEIATNPDLRALLASTQPVPASVPHAGAASEYPPVSTGPEPGAWAGFKARLAAARDAVGRAADAVTGQIVSRCRAVRAGVAAVVQATGEVLPVRRVLWVGAGVGLATGVMCLLLPHSAAAAVGAAGAACTATAAQVGSWLRRAARRVGLV